MTLGRKVYNEVGIVVFEEFVNQFAIADIASNEEASFVIDVVFDGSEVARIGQSIKHDDADVVVLVLLFKQVFNEIGADKTCCARD